MNPLAWLRADLWMVKLAGALAILAAIGYGLWTLHHDGYEAGRNEILAQWNAARRDQATAQKAALEAYARQLTRAEAQHDKDQALIDHLHAAAGRVRIHLPACAGQPAPGAAHPDGAAGLFPAGVDQSFAAFQDEVGGIIARCDQLNIDVRRANAR